jgi:MFS family permease
MGNTFIKSNNHKYLSSVLVDNVSSSFVTFVIPLFVLDITNSPVHLSIISLFSTLPFLVLGLPFGALVDRLNVKKILAGSDIIRSILFFCFSLISTFTSDSFFLIITIYLVTIISGCINVLNSISELTYISSFVHNDGFSAMNSKIYSIQYLVGLLLPVVGGIIYSPKIVNFIFLLCSILYLISSLLVRSMKVKKEDTQKKAKINIKIRGIILDVMIDVKEGFHILLKCRDVLYPLIIVSIFNLLFANFHNDSLVLLKNIMMYDSEKIGLLLSLSSLGALLGSLIVTKLSNIVLFKKILVGNLSVQLILRTLFLCSSIYLQFGLILFCLDFCQSILNIIIITNRQQLIDKKYLGRVNSIYKTVLIGINSIGFLVGGMISKFLGIYIGLTWGIIGLFIMLIAIFLFRRL